jgi:hypothetical protein
VGDDGGMAGLDLVAVGGRADEGPALTLIP